MIGEENAVKLRVLIADDHEWMLDLIDEILGGDFEVVGKVTDGRAMVEAASRLQPDLIITDLAMPGLTGIEASRQTLKARPAFPLFCSPCTRRCNLSKMRLPPACAATFTNWLRATN